MPVPNRTHLSDLRGVTRLAFDATLGVTEIVERMHRTIQQRPGPLGAAATDRTRGITGLVYRSIMGTMRLIGHGLDSGLAPVAGLLPAGGSTPGRDVFLSALNGVYGDYLAHTDNPLAIEMSLRYRGVPLNPDRPMSTEDGDMPDASGGRLLVMVHGLCLSDGHWQRDGHDHGAALARELGYVPLYLRYNSGLPVAQNGAALAGLLEGLVCRWPQPVQELVVIGHSMGGLVARSACYHAQQSEHNWLRSLRKLVFLGTPHHGAPLERGGQRLDELMDLSPYSAPFTRIGKRRSAGITDLRHGSITGGEHRVVPLPTSVDCYAAAATLDARRSKLSERLIGDGLVPLDSALGRHPDQARTLAIPPGRQWIGYQMGHLAMLNRRDLYEQLRDWLRD
ncbi:MAG: alpha/beta hydrolase [Gammaproteobacteria bacterium]